MRMNLDMAEAGIKWHPVDGTDDEALRKERVLAPLLQYVDSVRSRISVWKRWVRWHDVHAAADSVFSPTAFRMGLSATSCHGRTDCCNVRVCSTALVAGALGVSLSVDDELLRPFRQLKVSHTPQSAPVLPLRASQSLFRLATDPAGFLPFWLAQRSTIEDVDDTFVSGSCSRGKRRVRGFRPAFRWVM